MNEDFQVKSSLKDSAPCVKDLAVEVPKEAVRAAFDEVYRELRRTARVPGFRVGHAPKDLIARRYSEKAREEVLDRLVRRSLAAALKEQQRFRLVGRPHIEEVRLTEGEPMTYRARLETAPQVPTGKYKGLKLTRPPAEVPAEEVDKTLDRLREMHAQLKPMLEPRPAAAGDFLLVDLTRKPPGKAPKRQRDALIQLELEKDQNGILGSLVGMNPGETRTIEAPGGTKVDVELKTIKTRQLPELTDEFAKSVGAFDSLEALKSSVRGDLEQRVRDAQRRGLEAQAGEELIKRWEFDVPPSLVAQHARRLLEERAEELVRRGVPPEEVESRLKTQADAVKLEALKSVKLFFILKAVADAEKIGVGEEEMRQRIRALAHNMGKPEEEVRKELEEKELLEDLAWSMIRRKVLDKILQEADIQEGGTS